MWAGFPLPPSPCQPSTLELPSTAGLIHPKRSGPLLSICGSMSFRVTNGPWAMRYESDSHGSLLVSRLELLPGSCRACWRPCTGSAVRKEQRELVVTLS